MARRVRTVLELDEHGKSGWRAGCGCTTCRAAHSADVAAWRARRRQAAELEQLDDAAREQALADLERPADTSQAPLLLDPSAPAGEIERAFTEELSGLIGEPPWKKTLGALGRANARIIDQVPRHQRLDVVSGVQLRMMDILDRLRRVPEGGAVGGVPADWGASLADPD